MPANLRRFLFVFRVTAMARWHQIVVIKIVTHPVRIEHFRGNELPTDMANPIAEREFVTGIDPETVGKRQRLTGFLNDRALVGARDQERSDDEKEECLGSHEMVGGSLEFSDFRRRPNCSIFGHPESISKTWPYSISATGPPAANYSKLNSRKPLCFGQSSSFCWCSGCLV